MFAKVVVDLFKNQFTTSGTFIMDMQNSCLKMMYFSFGKSSVRQINFDRKKVIFVSLVFILTLTILISVSLKMFTGIYQNWRISHLRKANSELEHQIYNLEQKLVQLDNKVVSLERQDDDLRVFVDIPTINPDIRRLGTGGQSPAVITGYSSVNESLLGFAQNVDQQLFNLSHRLDLLIDSRDEIVTKYNKNSSQLRQTPSIHPVRRGRISDSFGYRIDPFTGQRKHHNGVDISAPRGTDIYSTADGIVIEAVSKYTPNQLRGKYVIIDHGFGFKTKYAHLSKVLVKPGQKIARYTVIGKVGDTGRATGPHLHYEVIKEDRQVNPIYYFMD